MTTFNPHLGSSLDDLLDADGVLAEAQAVAVKRVRGWRAVQAVTGQAVATDDDGALKLPVVLETDEDGWVVARCPTLPGCHSQGRTRDEALANIREAVTDYLASKNAYGGASLAAASFELVDVRA